MAEETKSELKQELSAQSAAALTTVTVATQPGPQITEQLKRSLNTEDEKVANNFVEKASVGDLNYQVINSYSANPNDKSATSKKPQLNQPKDIIKSEDFEISTPETESYKKNNFMGTANAAYNYDEQKIYLFQNPNLTPEEIAKLYPNANKKTLAFAEGNQIAMEATLYHEATHLKHRKYDGLSDLKYPIDIARGDRLTETTAYAVENLYAANKYMELKNRGIKTITLNGKEQPIESILEIWPGLKETVEKNGFNAKDPQSVRNVVECAGKYWKENRQKVYESQHKGMIDQCAKPENMMDTLKHDDKQFDKTAQTMLKEVYIGTNTSIDLTHCQDLLNTMSVENAKTMLKDKPIKSTQTLSYGKLTEINDYLDSIGIKDDKEKIAYLNDNFEKIVLRSGEHDEKLKAILLNTSSEKSNTIVYADNLTEKVTENGQRIYTTGNENDRKELAASLKVADKLHQNNLTTKLETAAETVQKTTPQVEVAQQNPVQNTNINNLDRAQQR